MVKTDNRRTLLKGGEVLQIGDIRIECILAPGMLPYLCIWLVARDLIADAPYDRAPVRQRGPDDLGRRIKKGSLSSVCTR